MVQERVDYREDIGDVIHRSAAGLSCTLAFILRITLDSRIQFSRSEYLAISSTDEESLCPYLSGRLSVSGQPKITQTHSALYPSSHCIEEDGLAVRLIEKIKRYEFIIENFVVNVLAV